MRKNTAKAIECFYKNEPHKNKHIQIKVDNENTYFILFKNKIAIKPHNQDFLYVSTCNWNTQTTREKLNGFNCVNIKKIKNNITKKSDTYLNGEIWDGKTKKIIFY